MVPHEYEYDQKNRETSIEGVPVGRNSSLQLEVQTSRRIK